VSKYDQPPNAAQRLTGTFEVTPDESEVETSARLERSRAHQLHQLWRERVILTAVTTGLSILFLFSLVTISLPQATTEAKEVAKQVLPALTTGLLGYFVGRRSGG
jgi:hypothetical protein